MQKLKFLFMIAFVAAFSMTINAQGLGLRAGVNFQNINGKDEGGDKLENNLIIGFNAGIVGEMAIAPDFYFQPGVLFSMKGTESEGSILGQTLTTTTLKLGYIEVPLNLVHKPLLGTGRLLLGVGPYVAFGVTGKGKSEAGGTKTDFDVEFKSEVEDSDPDEVFYFKRFDAGANLLAGYEFAGGLSFQLNVQLGLLDINPDYIDLTDDESKFTHTGFGLSLGYRFQ